MADHAIPVLSAARRYRRPVLVLVVAALIGLVAGRLTTTGRHTARAPIAMLPLLAAGVALRVAVPVLDGDIALVALAGSLGVLLCFTACNLHLVGVGVIGIGLLVNFAGVVANSGMPVRPAALVAANVIEPDEQAIVELDEPRHREDSSDRVAFLGDVLPIAPLRTVVSFGDLIIAAGLADVVAQLTRRRRQATSSASVAQDWGTAPSPSPVSGSQYSAKPERITPAWIDLDSEAATSSDRDLVDANHNR
jgi:hypothetical protein